MSDLRTYLPWLRTGLPSLIAAPDSPETDLAARATAAIELHVNDAAGTDTSRRASIGVLLYGPADVAGLDPAVIVRTEPHANAPQFEPSYFPFIEFRAADLPWIFTPASPNADRLRPWLCLAVLPASLATVTATPGQALPVLEVPVSELPDLSESWAWAHTQIVRAGEPGPPDGVAHVIGARPDRVVSRLVSPRRLQPDMRYLACVVPAFEAGRKAGLSEPLTSEDDRLKPAWFPSDASKPVRLPVYYQWQFSTGPNGDFETLLSRVTPVSLASESGMATVDVANPGWTMPVRPAGDPASVVPLEGVLRNPAAAPKQWTPEARAEFEARLQIVLNAGAQAPDARPLVLPPLYGREPARRQTVPAANQTPAWLREINLDPVLRAAAGAGAIVVRFEQDRLMSEAWRQLNEHQIQDQSLHLRQLAETVKQKLNDRLTVDSAAAQSSVLLGKPALRRLARAGGPIAKHSPRMAAAAAVGFSATDSGNGAAPQTDIPEAERFSPQFADATWEGLRIYFPELMLPGIGQGKPNSIALLKLNPKFIEAYLLGMNHEMGRELLWRGYPARTRATFFRSFWTGGIAEMNEIASWPPGSVLGTHLAAADQIVLLLRADLVRRFPRVRVYAAQIVQDATGKRLSATAQKQPLFRGQWSEEALLLGFALSQDEARGGGGEPGWYFVIEEEPVNARFGLNTDGGAPRDLAQINSWDSLRWEDLTESGGSALLYLQLAGRIAGIKDPRPLRAVAPSGPAAIWAKNSAHMAAITEQTPYRVAIHASKWLPQHIGG